jgi:hypothetical protein
MPTDHRTPAASNGSQQGAPTYDEIRTVQDAQKAFAPFIGDEAELKSAAEAFFKLAGQLAGRQAGVAGRERLLRDIFQRIVRDPATGAERTRDEKARALRSTLGEMREMNFAAQSSPAARRAHDEVDGFAPARDDMRESFRVPEGRSRAEHAGHLNGANREARDLFERGATLYGETLVIPREGVGSPDRGEQVRIGTLAHAVQEFEPLVGGEEAKLKAAEFVQLGREIAGSTADGDTRLVVFRAFYQDIKRGEDGRTRPSEEQAVQLEEVLQRMRGLAAAMRAEEWSREPAETVSLEDWEKGLEERQRDSERETHGHLTYLLEEALTLEAEDDAPGRERDLQDALLTERGQLTGVSAVVEYERIRLDELPPRVPEGLTPEEEARLRYEIIPHIDRQLEAGAKPDDVLRGLTAQAEAEGRRERDTEITHVLTSRAPEANRDHPLTRAEEAVALYTLRALRGLSPADDPALDDEFARRAFLPYERAAAIDTVGARLAQDYREQRARLNSFASQESERGRLLEEAARFSERQRATQDFQGLLAASRELERSHQQAEQAALVRGNDARIDAPVRASSGVELSDETGSNRTLTDYPELLGEQRPRSEYTEMREKNERAMSDLRGQLEAMLVSPEIEGALAENARLLEESARYFRGQTGRDIDNADEAREARAPELRGMRAALDLLADERAGLQVERTRPSGERQTNPLYVALPAQPGHRLAVGNVNEYRALVSAAEKVGTGVLAFTSRRGREITGASESREQELNFARDYVAYRLHDDTTRKLNENRLFREYASRLSGALTASELVEAVKEIRQDNYARARHPDKYSEEADAAKRRGEQPRRPMSEREMQQLFLDLTPSHFNDEMRAVLLTHSGTARDKAERIKGLESGALAPSASLRLLLAEFARTRSDDLARFGRNIRAFLADYLNPPAPNRLRFSAYNLYKLREKLSPAERDYFYKVVDDARQSITTGGAERQYGSRQSRLSHGEQVAGRSNLSPSTRGAEQPHPVDSLREHLEEKVSNYLLSVVRERGARALGGDGEGRDHAAEVARIIKDTITGRGHELEDLSLDDARVAAVSGKLVEELAHTLAPSRSRDFARDMSLEQQRPRTSDRANWERRAGGQQLGASEVERGIEDEVVEQKVSRVIGQITIQGFNRHDSGSSGLTIHGRHDPAAHDAVLGRDHAMTKHNLVR